MAANAEIFFEHDRWGRNLTWSLGAACCGRRRHSALRRGRCRTVSGEGWGAGGGGDAMGVTLVSNVPLPANPVTDAKCLANESKGMTQSQPKPEVEENAGRDSDPGQDHQDQAGAEDQRHPAEAASRSR